MSKHKNNEPEAAQAAVVLDAPAPAATRVGVDALVLDAARAEARRLKAQQLLMPTPEEDAVITAAALSDPDNLPQAEGAMADFTPASLTPAVLAAGRQRTPPRFPPQCGWTVMYWTRSRPPAKAGKPA